MRLLTFLTCLISFTVFAQTTQTVDPATATTTSACPPAAACPECPKCETRGRTEGYRADSIGSIMVGYQYLNTWVIGKQSASYTHNIGKHWGIEFEFATSKRKVDIADYDIGEVKEDRYSLLAKYFIGNSFHFSFGPYMYDMEMDTADSISDRLGDRINDIWTLEGYGLAVAFGNRWQTSWGLTYGVDWVRMNVPLIDGKIVRRTRDLDEEDENNVERTFKILRRIPGFTFAAVSIGYTF